jgi:hypothetical protein
VNTEHRDDLDEPEDFIDACEDARDALRRVLVLAEPGTGRRLHDALAELREILEAQAAAFPNFDSAAPPPPPHEPVTRGPELRELPLHVRERHLIEALGDQRLTVKELREVMMERLADEDVWVNPANVQSLLRRLMDRGEVAREAEVRPGGRTAVRYRYHRRATLQGPIADLERALADETGTQR